MRAGGGIPEIDVLEAVGVVGGELGTRVDQYRDLISADKSSKRVTFASTCSRHINFEQCFVWERGNHGGEFV